MSKHTKQVIITEATQIKNYIETNKKIPISCKLSDGVIVSPYGISYLMACCIKDNFKSAYYPLTSVVQYNTTKHNDTIQNEKVTRAEYLIMIDNFIKYCIENKRVPSYITTRSSKTKVSFELFLYCLSKIVVYYQNNKTLPNTCTFNKGFIANTGTTTQTVKNKNSQSTSTSKNCTNPYTSTPHYLESGCNKLGQCTSYYCGPHSIHQAIRKFGITKYTEKQIAAWCGTTTSGTDHNGINTAIAKISKETGIKLTVQWKNFSDMGNTIEERFQNIAKLLCQPNKAILWHILYDGKYGHYEVLDKINTKTKYVRALNSLGIRKRDGSYPGYPQDRTYNLQAGYARNTPGGQKALCIITKG